MTLRTNVTWLNTALALLIAVGVGVQGSPAMGTLCGIATVGAIGIWRAVRFLGAILELQQVQVFEPDAITASDSE